MHEPQHYRLGPTGRGPDPLTVAIRRCHVDAYRELASSATGGHAPIVDVHSRAIELFDEYAERGNNGEPEFLEYPRLLSEYRMNQLPTLHHPEIVIRSEWYLNHCRKKFIKTLERAQDVDWTTKSKAAKKRVMGEILLPLTRWLEEGYLPTMLRVPSVKAKPSGKPEQVWELPAVYVPYWPDISPVAVSEVERMIRYREHLILDDRAVVEVIDTPLKVAQACDAPASAPFVEFFTREIGGQAA